MSASTLRRLAALAGGLLIVLLALTAYNENYQRASHPESAVDRFCPPDHGRGYAAGWELGFCNADVPQGQGELTEGALAGAGDRASVDSKDEARIQFLLTCRPRECPAPPR